MTIIRCAVCGDYPLRVAGPSGRPQSRGVCRRCGSCWEASGRGSEVDTLACPGCPERVVCESRPTALATSLSSEHRLADGTRLLIRPVLYSDRYALADGYRRLSEESRRLRFFSAPSSLSDADLDYLTKLDYRDHFAWAAFALDEESAPGVAVARYIRDPKRPSQAEPAVTVLDAYQHRGLGTLLLLMLADRARVNGIDTFVSYILWDNREILATLKHAGARIEPEEPGVARVEMDIPDPETGGLADVVRTALRSFGRAARAFLGVEPTSPDVVVGPSG